jgi:hypothetical protein
LSLQVCYPSREPVEGMGSLLGAMRSSSDSDIRLWLPLQAEREEAKRKAKEEAKRKAEEEACLKAEAEAKAAEEAARKVWECARTAAVVVLVRERKVRRLRCGFE